MPKILITGSGRRIGRGLALEFAHKRWDVIIHYNKSGDKAMNTIKEIESLGTKAMSIKADIRNYDELKRSFEKAFENFGVPDVLMNNAGVFPERRSLSELSPDDWDDTLNINLRGQYLASRIFAGYAGAKSRIINIASIGGLEAWKQRIPYNVSKSGVIHLTKALAKELAPKITVNCICPGAILMEEEPSVHDSSMVSVERIPMKRYGNVKDIFDAVYFFATCSEYITGQVLCVDGGFHEAR